MGYDDDIITEIARVVVNGTAEHVSLKGLKAHHSTTETNPIRTPGLSARDTQCHHIYHPQMSSFCLSVMDKIQHHDIFGPHMAQLQDTKSKSTSKYYG